MNRTLIIMAGFIAVALLAGGAFMAARLLNAGDSGTGSGQGNINIVAEDSGGGAFALSLDIKPAPELPPTPPETGGVFVRREDNSIFVGTGEIDVMAEAKNDGPPTLSVNFSGPVLEVVVTRDTTLYRDETEFPTPGQAASGEQSVQQIVTLVDSLDELGPDTKNAELQIWGTRSGDRVVAQVVVYRLLGSI